MNREKTSLKIVLIPPAVESFLDPDRASDVWPEKIATNETFLKQLRTRKTLNDQLNDILNSLPQSGISLESAINQGYFSEKQVEEIYTSLSDLLEFDQDYERILLYLPFEFLPRQNWFPVNEKLQRAVERFKRVYMKIWKSLLSVYDVRANFVDGDVMEDQHRVGDFPRVVKAAHLIPKLVEKGLMRIEDIIALIKESDDQILKSSIADTFPTLNYTRALTAKGSKVELRPRAITFSSIQDELREKFSRIKATDHGEITERRRLWLKRKAEREVVRYLGNDVSDAITRDVFSDNLLTNFLAAGVNIASQQVLVEGIRKAIESTALIDLSKARILYERYREKLLILWEKDVPEIRETLLKTFRRLHRLDLVDEKQLTELNIAMPKLFGALSENLKLLGKELRDLRNMITSLESNPELSQLIYPVVLVYGSCLKGYGAQSADLDLGVFVRPDVSIKHREQVRNLIEKTFLHEKIRDGVLEFWLEEKGGTLTIRDFLEPDLLLGRSHWTYTLFGAAWLGDQNLIRELYEKLLVSYIYDADKVIYGHNARSLYLEGMERDALQYRLMHEGYERFFPSHGGLQTPHADRIDGQSMFWDSGYRRLATRIFVSRVFLPKIPT